MLILCGTHDVRPGDIVGASIAHPASPGLELLKRGVVIDAGMLASVVRLGVPHIWIEDDATRDVDGAIAGQLTEGKMEIFKRLKEDLRTVSGQTVTAADVQSARGSVLSLVCLLIANGRYAGLTDSLFGCGDLAGHATNVAYLSILIGLEVQAYIIKERPRLMAGHARDMGVLGLAGMLHDIGKAKLDAAGAARHEVHSQTAAPQIGEYEKHALDGYQMLRATRGAASVTQVALNHHQRFDGSGWPDMAVATRGRITGTQSGHKIHVLTRIVSAANVLDNLLRTAQGERVPPVSALHAFASSRFDGWFDPIIRRATLRRVPPFAMGSQITLSDGRRAVVVAPNLVEPCRPSVRPLKEKGPAAPTVDLSRTPQLTITHYLGEDVAKWVYTVPPLVEETSAPGVTPQPATPNAAAEPQRRAA